MLYNCVITYDTKCFITKRLFTYLSYATILASSASTSTGNKFLNAFVALNTHVAWKGKVIARCKSKAMLLFVPIYSCYPTIYSTYYRKYSDLFLAESILIIKWKVIIRCKSKSILLFVPIYSLYPTK